jgi:hypothetical protein
MKLFKKAFIIVFLISCNSKTEKPIEMPVENNIPQVIVPEFIADSAYAFIKTQCDFGPRVPNSKGHIACGDYLVKKMTSWADTVIVQKGVVTAYDGTRLNFRNIVATFNPKNKNRILLFAHWDTRPWADKDEKDKDKPIIGADDGASGVGVLMEVARLLKLNKIELGIDIIFFDAEDYGKEGGGSEAEDTYALGTQYWTKNLHVPGYTANYGILLDMVGAKNAQFRYEGLSYERASNVVLNVWNTAESLGYSNYFLRQDGGWVTDDHVYVNEMGIPAIDIINSDLSSRNGFAKHWHTHADNMDVIDKNTLRAVGQTLMSVLFRERFSS